MPEETAQPLGVMLATLATLVASIVRVPSRTLYCGVVTVVLQKPAPVSVCVPVPVLLTALMFAIAEFSVLVKLAVALSPPSVERAADRRGGDDAACRRVCQ